MQGEMQDKCGVVGVYSYDESVDVASWIYSGLYTIQHRGQESAGISVLKEGRINTHVGMGLVSDVFDNNLLDILNGNVGIGHVRYSTTGDSSHENCSPFVEHKENIIISKSEQYIQYRRCRYQYFRNNRSIYNISVPLIPYFQIM